MEEKRCAVVTRGNRGIGFEIRRQLALNGVDVILASINESRGVEAVQKLNNTGLSNVIFHRLDIKDPSSISCLAKFIETRFKKLDILVISSVHGIGISLFPNLVKLAIGVSHFFHWNLLMQPLLTCMPNVESITFLEYFWASTRKRYQRRDLESTRPATSFLQLKMKEITPLNHEAVAEEELPFIEYLLNHTTKLEMRTLHAHEIDSEMRERILSLDRGSSLCRVDFV